ncbi:MAG: FimB/Mfa2 family fimbrial subunit [Bacteroides sp.]|nr:FimB/Mfa2 family fimbrial subunit [Bacteroides sp.]
MTKHTLRKYAAGLCLALVCAGCTNSIGTEEPEEADKRTVVVNTRSAGDGEVGYPLTLYAFDSADGTAAASATATSADDELLLTLQPGTYRLLALGGTNGGASLADNPTRQSTLAVPANGYLTQPLQRGAVDITLAQDATANITLSYEVARVDITLKDIPTEVTAVQVTLSSLYSTLTLDGETGGETNAVVSLTKGTEAGSWSSPTFYVLPGKSSDLTLSIALTTAEGTQSYGYTHSGNLVKGTPYTLTGSYKAGFTVDASLTAAGWLSGQAISFAFGEGATDDDDTTNSGTTDTEETVYTVTEIPAAKKMWEEHLVVKTSTADDGTTELLLLSLQEWTASASEAEATIASYAEKAIGNWRIPTVNEAKAINPAVFHTNNFSNINELLESNDGDALTQSEKYLCKDGETIKYFISSGNASVIALAVSASSTYNLRAVRTVKVKLATE